MIIISPFLSCIYLFVCLLLLLFPIIFDLCIFLWFSDPDYCFQQLGMKDGRIEIGQITASSVRISLDKPTGYHGVQYARLDTLETNSSCGGWRAMNTVDADQWIQVNLRGVMWVSGVMIQGRNSDTYNVWVTKFKVMYKMYGMDWTTVQTLNEQDMVSECVFAWEWGCTA